MELSFCCAGGSRRSCAAPTIYNILHAAELVAVVAPGEHQERVALALRRELESHPATRVLPVDSATAPWIAEFQGRAPSARVPAVPAGVELSSLWTFLQGHEAEEGSVRRSVLVWQGVDAFIHDYPARFERAIDVLCSTLTGPPDELRCSAAAHRAVLIGGDALLGRLEQVAARVPDEVRFRYLLVA